MANVNLPNVEGMNNVEELKNAVAKLTKELLFILNNLDTRNVNEINAEKIVAESITSDKIAANSITADRMDVNELSAISADLGHITAGLIQAVNIIGSIITGTIFQTQYPGQYPRIELNNTNNSMIYEKNANEFIVMGWDRMGDLGMTLSNLMAMANVDLTGNTLYVGTPVEGDVSVYSTLGNVDIGSHGGGKHVRFLNWSNVLNRATKRTLQQDFDAINTNIATLFANIISLNSRVSALENSQP